MSVRVKFKIKDDPFYRELNKRVDQYFKETGYSKNAGIRMYLKSLTLISSFFILGAIIYLDILHGAALFLVMVLWMFNQFVITIGVAHDGSHNCYFKNKKWNRRLMNIFDLIGINSEHWIENHIISHHGMPNVPIKDSAIESFSVVRLHPRTPQFPLSRYQHFFMFGIYAVATLFQVYLLEFVSFAQNLVGFNPKEHNLKKEITVMLASKMFALTYTLLLPLYLSSAPADLIFAGWFVGHLCCGVALGVIFMTTHLHQDTQFIECDENGFINDSYARHIMKTTSEFSVDSAFANWITGGLNLHVTHHLFPAVSQIHLPALQKIVEKTAEEFGIKYYKYTFFEAIRSHLRQLKKLGNMPSYEVEKVEESFA